MYKILVVNNAEPTISRFTAPIEKIISKHGAKSVLVEYADCPDIDFQAYHGIILSGSPQGNDIVEHHLPYFEWVKTCEVPVLGICAGHHIIGFMHGSKILRSAEPESGDYEVEIIQNDILFSNLPKNFKVKQMHNDSITLPENFYLLATSKTCLNQIMKHKTKALYTCQFHPEIYNHELIENFLNMCFTNY